MSVSKKSLAAAAVVASALLGSACGTGAGNTGSTQQAIKCAGINNCSGQGACGGKNKDGTSHDCAGKNACKGQGWQEVASEKECTDKGGSVLKG
jgi:hypothetical protein